MVIIFSWAAPLLLECEELFRRDFGVLLPNTEEALSEEGIEVLLRARDFAELRLALRDELLKFGVRGATGIVGGASFANRASELVLRCSSSYWKLSQNCSDVSTSLSLPWRSRELPGDPENRCFLREASGDGVDGTLEGNTLYFGAIFPNEANPATSKAEMADLVDVFALVST